MNKLIVAAVLVISLPAFGEEIEESDLIGTWRIDTHFIIHEEDEITTTPHWHSPWADNEEKPMPSALVLHVDNDSEIRLSNKPGELWHMGIPAHILWALNSDLAKLTIVRLWTTGEIGSYTYTLSRVNEDIFLYITPEGRGRAVGALVRDARLQELLDMLRLPE